MIFIHINTRVSRQQYLMRIYPLLKPDVATKKLFNSLNFYQSPYPNLHQGITFRYFKHEPPKLGALTCLDWTNCKYHKLLSHHGVFYLIYHISGDVFKNDYDPQHFNNYPLKHGYPSNSYIEVYHNLWYDEPGHYFYHFKGTGNYLNVGKTLVANNKVGALLKLGLTEQEIFSTAPSFQNRLNQPVTLFSFVKQFAESNHISFSDAIKQVIDMAAHGSSYNINRVANSDDYDYTLWLVGQRLGYDTIQMTIQPNGNSGWGYEVLDLRSKENDTGITQWQHLKKYLSIRDPNDLTRSEPCRFHVPFKQLYCQRHV